MDGNMGIADILPLVSLTLVLVGSIMRNRQCMRASLCIAGIGLVTTVLYAEQAIAYALLGSLIAIANAVTFIRSKRVHAAQLTTTEAMIHQQHLATLSVADARLFFDQGQILSAMPGAMLTQEAMPVTGLYFLVKGRVEISIRDEVITHLQPGAIIGESCLLPDAVASASVHVVGGESLLWYIDADTVLALITDHPPIKEALMAATLVALSEKLTLANRLSMPQATPLATPLASPVTSAA